METRDNLTFSAEEAREIIYGDHPDFTEIENHYIDVSRWEIHYRTVVLNKLTNKFYQVYYSKGATEIQDTQPFEFDTEVVFEEVFPAHEVITVYR